MSNATEQLEKYKWFEKLNRIDVDCEVTPKLMDLFKLITEKTVVLNFLQKQEEQMKTLSNFGFNI